MVSMQTKIACVAGLVVFGCLNTICSKIQFTMVVEGFDGTPKNFEKPFFATFTMFVAMTVVLFYHLAGVGRPKKSDNQQTLLDEPKISEFKAFMLISVPATFDLLATGLMLWGLLLMSASIYQMLRGSMIIFSSLIRTFVFGKVLTKFEWCGVLICVGGITAVGASTILNQGFQQPGKQVSVAESYLGIFLVIIAQVLQAGQMVVEEKLLKDVKLPPLQIVGYEGLWGLLEFMVVFPVLQALPGSDNGHFEDYKESFYMVYNSWDLKMLILVYLFSCSTMNISSVMVTYAFNAIHRTMLEATRTSAIWIVGLTVHYYVSSTIAFGEKWLPFSWMEAMGFVLLLVGQATYGQVIRWPCFSGYDEK